MSSSTETTSTPNQEPTKTFDLNEEMDAEPSQPSRTNSKKRKSRRGGAAQRIKKVNNTFDHENRQRCSECQKALSCWNCAKCDRTLPNGNWADLRLGAEDENDSLFGRFRFLANLLIFSREEEELFYRKVQGIVKFFAETGILLEIEDPTRDMATGPHPQMAWVPPTPDWTWSREMLFAENEDNSFMGALRRLLELGHIRYSIINEWAWFARSLAKTWSKFIDSQSPRDGSSRGTDIRTALGSPCPDEDDIVDFNDKYDREAIFSVVREASKEGVSKEDADSDAGATSHRSNGSSQGLSEARRTLADRRAAQKRGRRPSKVSAEGVATKEDLAELVRARNAQLEAEEAEKLRTRQERQEQKNQIKAKKVNVAKIQSNPTSRTVYRHRRSRHEPVMDQDRTQKPHWEETLMGGLIPALDADPDLFSQGTPGHKQESSVISQPEAASEQMVHESNLRDTINETSVKPILEREFSGAKEAAQESSEDYESVRPVVIPAVSSESSDQTTDHTRANRRGTFGNRAREYPYFPSPRGNLDGLCIVPSNESPGSTIGLGAIDSTSESVSTRIRQLSELNFLTDTDYHTIYVTFDELNKQAEDAIESDPSWIEGTNMPDATASWKWSDLQLSAEDEYDSKLDISRKLVSSGHRSETQHQKLRSIALRLTKLWLIADSTGDLASAQGAQPDQRRVTFAEGADVRFISPAPGSEVSGSDSSEKGIRQDQDNSEQETEEEIIVFQPRGSH